LRDRTRDAPNPLFPVSAAKINAKLSPRQALTLASDRLLRQNPKGKTLWRT
jgi:hypothetical protein